MGVLILLVRTELVAPGSQLLSRETFNQFFTIHGSTMVFLVVTPLAFALGVYIVPLQIGAAEIFASRLPLLGYVLVVSGGSSMWLGFALECAHEVASPPAGARWLAGRSRFRAAGSASGGCP